MGIPFSRAAKYGKYVRGTGQLCSFHDLTCGITSIQSRDQTPITCPHLFPLVSPSFTPLNAVAVVAPFSIGPETEVERRDEKDPIETFASSRIGEREVVRGTEMQRVRSPDVRSVLFRDDSIVNLHEPAYQHHSYESSSCSYVFCSTVNARLI